MYYDWIVTTLEALTYK